MAKRLTKKGVVEALIAANGVLSVAAESLHCSRRAVYDWIEREPDLQSLIDQLRETRIDRAENKLDEAIDKGEQWAVALTLRTIGRKRGYGDSVDVTSGGEPITFRINVFDDNETD